MMKAGLGDCSEATILGGLLTLAAEMDRYGAAFEKKGLQVLSADAAKRKDRTPAPPSSAPAPSGVEVGA